MTSHDCALPERANIVFALAPVTPSSSTCTWVSGKYYNRSAIVISVTNTTDTVTGSAIGLQQATAVAGTGAKTLSFTKVWANTDTDTTDAFTLTDVSSDTFTTTTVTSRNALYVIDLKDAALDVENGFDCFRATVGDATAATVSVHYIMEGNRYPDSAVKSAIVD